ncbi:MAG: hypothetical protein NVS4B2_29230 [Chloroflexota bacterium]
MLGLIHLWVSSYERVALVLALAFCMGYPVSRKIVGGVAGPLVALFVGFATLSLVVCLLGWLGLFYGLSIAIVGAAAGAFTIRCLARDLAGRRSAGTTPLSATFVVSVSVLFIALLGFSVLTLYPSTSLAYDATSYHLPLARDLVQHHGLVYDPFVRYSFFPQGNEAMFAVMLLLSGNPVSSAALEYSVLALVVLLMPLWFRDTGRRPAAGLVAGLLVLASPVVIWAGTAAFVDTWTLAFVAVALIVGLDAAQGRARPVPMMLVCGLLLGEAAATKYTGAAFGACAFAAVLLTAGRSCIPCHALLVALGGFAAVALPWYAWTLHTTGDPVYPFAVGLFGNRHGLWTAGEISYQNFVARGDITAGVVSVLHRDWQYLRGSVPYSTGAHRSPLSWVLAASFLPMLARSAWHDRAYIGVAAASLLCVGISVFISADPRYLVPALGIIAVCGGLAADWALRAAGRKLHLRPRISSVAAVLVAVPSLWSSASYAYDFRSQNGNPPTAPARVNAYIAARTPCYPAVTWLNDHAGSAYRAWSYNCEDTRYYAHGLLIGDVFSTGSVFRIFNNAGLDLPTAATLRERLAPLSAQWLILPVTKVPDPRTLEVGGLFALVTTAGSMDVFRVADYLRHAVRAPH